MLNTVLVALAMTGIVVCEPGIGGLADFGGAGAGIINGAYNGGGGHAGNGFNPGHGGGTYGGGGIFRSLGSGGFLRGLGSSLFGRGHGSAVTGTHGNYGGAQRGPPIGGKGIPLGTSYAYDSSGPKAPGSLSLGTNYVYDTAEETSANLKVRSPNTGNGIRHGYGLPTPAVHDENPWRPIQAAPINVILKKPAHETYSHASSHQVYNALNRQVYGAPSQSHQVYKAPSLRHQVYKAVNHQTYGASSQNHLAVTPSLSYGYSYKLIPTYAYGPTISGGDGNSVKGYGG